MKIFICGDVFLDEKINLSIGDNLNAKMKECDICCANFESPIINDKSHVMKKRGPALKNNRNLAKQMSDNGFNLVTLANNHIFDYGVNGIDNTINILQKNNIASIGAGTSHKDI